ncbi:endonuclease [Rhodobacterales bacterium HKCCE2091]|nr:endonuclease [Rhodobacterales bacterium HKCCE2091]
MSTLNLVTWNVHRCKGRDGRCDPSRIAKALKEDVATVGPQVLALQEADDEGSDQVGLLDLSEVESATGLRYVPGLRWGPDSHGFQGSVLFLAPELEIAHADVLDLPGVWPRGAVVLDLAEPALRLVATHLSLSLALRAAQMRTIGQYLARRPPLPLVVAGDLNEWMPWGSVALSRKVTGQRLRGPVRRTFPSSGPTLPLDRILGGDGVEVTEARALDTPALRAASDHLPLAGRLRLRRGATSG